MKYFVLIERISVRACRWWGIGAVYYISWESMAANCRRTMDDNNGRGAIMFGANLLSFIVYRLLSIVPMFITPSY